MEVPTVAAILSDLPTAKETCAERTRQYELYTSELVAKCGIGDVRRVVRELGEKLGGQTLTLIEVVWCGQFSHSIHITDVIDVLQGKGYKVRAGGLSSTKVVPCARNYHELVYWQYSVQHRARCVCRTHSVSAQET